jgi:hypothetical protein
MTLVAAERPDGAEVVIDQEALNAEALFSLGDHELVDPEDFEGKVVGVNEIDATEVDPRIRLVEIHVEDPFVAADPIGYAIVQNHVENVIEPMIRRENTGATVRTEATSIDELNPFSQAWLAQPELQSLKGWRSLVPTARALDYLTDPSIGREVVDKDGSVTVSTAETAAHWRFVDDAIGIRTRAVAMKTITEEFLAGKVEQGDEAKPFNWLSLASGTAEPSLKAAKAIMDTTGNDVNLVVADWDGKSLKLVAGNAERIGYEGELTTLQQNILDENLADQVAEKAGVGQYEVVEDTGFKEYLPEDGDTMAAYKGQGLPQASEFTRRQIELVAPGGMMISGNMILLRSQGDFVFGAVDWPLINARFEQEILGGYQKAGILDDPNLAVTMYRVIARPAEGSEKATHIYNLVTVEKSRDYNAA